MSLLRSLGPLAGPSRPTHALLSFTTMPNALAGPSRVTRLPAASPFSSSAPVEKLKSHSGTKKRFSPTASGLWKRGQAGKQHLNTGFSASRINRLGKIAYATKTQVSEVG
ncbi:hypothetical protein EHS25_005223 [Saitozyma podzolica]|uniref:50S ribosomal protein L35 n=1 Tax=Saitozyma podzolica TaxID=1890683 RepID=A0A427XYL9_9TREE|nr:hypothetical protein EHS25_005223 [Saitozyma podzolica]